MASGLGIGSSCHAASFLSNGCHQKPESAHKGVNQRSEYATQVQQERPESPTVALTWRVCKHKVHQLHLGHILSVHLTWHVCKLQGT